jgi:NAD(P)H-flavin reductase/hemoglobin-like flavoprotein
MSPEDRILKECFARIETDPAAAMAYFYGRLFAAEPRLRALFPPAMGHQHDRFFDALGRLVRAREHPEELAGHLEGLGRRHRTYGVLSEHHPAVEEALTATLRTFAADVWTAEAEDAWRTAYRAAADTMVRAAERNAADAPPWWVAEVTGHDRRAPDLAVLTLRPGRPLPFASGQHVRVQTSRWPRIWRPYSIANAPRPDGTLRLHVRALPAGWVSGSLVRHTEPGDTVLLGPPEGGLTPDPRSGRTLLLVGGGTGLAPMKALAEQAAATARDRDVILLVAARDEAGLYDLPELRLLEAGFPRLRVVPVLSRDQAPDALTGRVPDLLPGLLDAARDLDPAQDLDACVAGPAPMVRATVTALQRLGMPLTRVHHDLLTAGG